MKQFLKITAVLLLLIPGWQLQAQAVYEDFVDGEIYMKIRDNYPMDGKQITPDMDFKRLLPFLANFESVYGIHRVEGSFYFARSEPLRRVLRVHFSQIQAVDALVRALNQVPEVEFAEKIPLYKVDHTPNDLGINSSSPGQYSLYLTQAELAWAISRGDPTVVVAAVDNAVQATHPDLNAIAGRDVADGDNNPDPPTAPPLLLTHGTHVAGISGARTDNGLNVASIGNGISIMPVKCTRDTSSTNKLTHAYEGVTWAAMNGADVINMSWGGFSGCAACALAISNAQASGSILVAAAGNDNKDTTSFPAQYPGVIVVANTDFFDTRSGSSNFGTWIDVSAPGEDIQSLFPFNKVGPNSGTSMASPFVAGLIGLALSARDVYSPGMSNADVVNCVLSTADNIDADNPGFIGRLGSGRVNAYEALKCIVPCPAVYVEPAATYTGGLVRYRQASAEVHSDVVCNGCELTHNSGGFIRLTPPFHVVAGSEYRGYIEGCGSSKPAPLTGNEVSQDRSQPVDDEATFSIFPNPSTGFFKVRVKLDNESEVKLRVIDQNGKTVQAITPTGLQPAGVRLFEVREEQLQPGIYFVQLQTGSTVQMRSVAVVR